MVDSKIIVARADNVRNEFPTPEQKHDLPKTRGKPEKYTKIYYSRLHSPEPRIFCTN